MDSHLWYLLPCGPALSITCRHRPWVSGEGQVYPTSMNAMTFMNHCGISRFHWFGSKTINLFISVYVIISATEWWKWMRMITYFFFAYFFFSVPDHHLEVIWGLKILGNSPKTVKLIQSPGFWMIISVLLFSALVKKVADDMGDIAALCKNPILQSHEERLALR